MDRENGVDDRVAAFRRLAWAMDRETVDAMARVDGARIAESNRLREQGAYEQAAAVLETLDENVLLGDPTALTARALARMGLADHAGALSDLDAAERRLRLHLGVTDINRAQVYNRQRRHGEARAAAARAVERMPDEAWWARVSLASSCELDGDGEAAEDALREMAATLAGASQALREEAVSYIERTADLDALRARINVRSLLGCD